MHAGVLAVRSDVSRRPSIRVRLRDERTAGFARRRRRALRAQPPRVLRAHTVAVHSQTRVKTSSPPPPLLPGPPPPLVQIHRRLFCQRPPLLFTFAFMPPSERHLGRSVSFPEPGGRCETTAAIVLMRHCVSKVSVEWVANSRSDGWVEWWRPAHLARSAHRGVDTQIGPGPACCAHRATPDPSCRRTLCLVQHPERSMHRC